MKQNLKDFSLEKILLTATIISVIIFLSLMLHSEELLLLLFIVVWLIIGMEIDRLPQECFQYIKITTLLMASTFFIPVLLALYVILFWLCRLIISN